MELFRRNSKVSRFDVTKGNVIDACLDYNIIIEKQLMDIALLIKEISGKNSSVIDSADCINKAVFCSWNNDIYPVSEDFLYSL